MSDLPTPAAARLTAPSWRDARLILGVLLVLVSVVLGSVVVSRADRTVPMYAARAALLPGEQVTAADLTRVDVRLQDGMAGYLSGAVALDADTYVLREVRPGELVPASALGGAGEVDVQPVSLLVDATSAGSLTVGSLVDVYVNEPVPQGRADEFQGAQRVLGGAAVTALPQDGGVLGGVGSTRPVQVSVPSETVATLITAVDGGARVTLVPVPGARVRGG